MRIAIATVQVPFARGGAEIMTEMLRDELRQRGHEAEIVSIPFAWTPWQSLAKSMHMGRMMDLSGADGRKIDKVIAMKFPAYYVKHERKVYWLMHQHRQAYDFWGTPYSDIEHWDNGNQIREWICACDKKYLTEGGKVFTIARNVSTRLKKYCGINSTPLYHPPLHHEKLHCEAYGNFVFYPSRINSSKRQHLLVEAARFLRTDAKILLAGSGNPQEIETIRQRIEDERLQDRVTLAGFISDEDKISYYAKCLAVYFGAYDEDYGYITLEGFFSEKPVIVHTDAGGPLEFVKDGENGYVIPPEPQEIARVIDELYNNRDKARELGKNGRKSLEEKQMDWDYVIEQLLSD